MSSLVQLAKDILRQAEALEGQLKDINEPLPTLEAGSPWCYPSTVDHPEIWSTRQSLATMSKHMLHLSLGPADTIRYMVGPEACTLPLLKVMDEFAVYELVPRDRPISFEELASKMKVHPGIVKRVFSLAFGSNMFKEEPKGYVVHTSLSTALSKLSGWIKLAAHQGIQNAMLHWPESMLQYDEPLKPAMIPWNIGNGHNKAFFDVMMEEDGMAMFTDAMKSSGAGRDGDHFVYGFDWAGLGKATVVDLGGGNGHIAIQIAHKYPDLDFVIQDLEANKEHAGKLIPAELQNRITFQVQDFFEPQAVNTGAKAFFLRHIIHDWADEDAARILTQLVPEVDKGARIFICDRVPEVKGARPTVSDSTVQYVDLLMWTILGAKERTVEQWTELLEKTDERLKILRLKQPEGTEFSMIEVGF